MKTFFLLIATCYFSIYSFANPVKDSLDLGFAIKVSYAFGSKKSGRSGLTASAAIGVSKANYLFDAKELYITPTYQLAVNVYHNGLGNNLLKKYNRVEVDIVNTLAFATGYNPVREEYMYYFKTHNNMTASHALMDMGRYSFTFSTNFTANNHKRNQQTAYAGVTAYLVRIGYYNDGVPFNITRAVDGDDRWWTGGGFIQIGDDKIHDKETESAWKRYKVMVSYERFTGDVQDAYRLATRIGLNYIPVKEEAQNFNNRANLAINIAHQDGWKIGFNWLGHYPWDIQDFIHKGYGFAKHYSYANNFRLFSIEYNDFFLNQKIK